MQQFQLLQETVIIRHPKEKKSKCSLQPLLGYEGIRFLEAKPGFRFNGTGHVHLTLNAPVLSKEDGARPLLLLDSTWRLLPDLERVVVGAPIKRSLPAGIATAYPRISKLSQDPMGGLASIEALYVAFCLTGRSTVHLLDHYHWRDKFLADLHFLAKNRMDLSCFLQEST